MGAYGQLRLQAAGLRTRKPVDLRTRRPADAQAPHLAPSLTPSGMASFLLSFWAAMSSGPMEQLQALGGPIS